MDIHGPTRFCPTKPPPSNRYLGAFPHAPPSVSSVGNELNEDDIFTTDISESNDYHLHHNNNNNNNVNGNSSSSSNNRKTSYSESFGILAALPESPTQSHFYHKALASLSSSRAIPSIPKPPQQERVLFGKNQHHSSPVNVPMMARAMKDRQQFDNVDDDDDDDGEVVPPHEMVARAHTPVVACSVVEGVGRTLKGRDLRQVRNALWRRIGFMD